MRGSKIGKNCNIGQNVVIGPDVEIGSGCKIQNNVSLYKGVTLEDEVFAGRAWFSPMFIIPGRECAKWIRPGQRLFGRAPPLARTAQLFAG